MSDELDPEVLADLQLRKASEHDRTRTRGQGVYDWKPDPTVAQWVCRNASCRALVDVPQICVDRLAAFNANYLAPFNLQPILTSEVMVCDGCRKLLAAMYDKRNRNQVDTMADALRKLRASSNPEGELELQKLLTKCGYHDVPGTVRALRDTLNAKAARKADRMTKGDL
jgi:hypothetical protein